MPSTGWPQPQLKRFPNDAQDFRSSARRGLHRGDGGMSEQPTVDVLGEPVTRGELLQMMQIVQAALLAQGMFNGDLFANADRETLRADGERMLLALQALQEETRALIAKWAQSHE